MRKRPHTRFWRLPGVAPPLGWSLASAPEPTVPAAALAIVSATVLPMDSEQTLPDHKAVFEDGRLGARA